MILLYLYCFVPSHSSQQFLQIIHIKCPDLLDEFLKDLIPTFDNLHRSGNIPAVQSDRFTFDKLMNLEHITTDHHTLGTGLEGAAVIGCKGAVGTGLKGAVV
jgi:hypothetical protein